MPLPRFFSRVATSVGQALAVSSETLETTLQEVVVGVRCGESCRLQGNARMSAELGVNLLARLYPRLSLGGPSECVEALGQLARSINPGIELTDLLAPARTTLAFHVEEGAEEIYARSDGWALRVTRVPEAPVSPGPSNPYAAAAVAALAAAELFRRVFRAHLPHDLSERDVRLSLLDFTATGGMDEALAPHDLGQLAFFGLGAVANGALWTLLRHPGLTGELSLVEPQTVELSNLQRYVLTTDADAVAARKKTELVGALLAGTGLRHSSYEESLQTFADRFPRGLDIPTVCVSIDDIPGRRHTQALLPRLVLNGATSESGLAASWHELGRDAACLACLYQPKGVLPSQTELVAKALGLEHDRRMQDMYLRNEVPVGQDFERIVAHLKLSHAEAEGWAGKPLQQLYTGLVCGSVTLNLRGVGAMDAVPLAHQSALAGIFMAAELVKRTSPVLRTMSQPQTLVALNDVRYPPPSKVSAWTFERPREPRCICGDVLYQDVYARRWGGAIGTPDH